MNENHDTATGLMAPDGWIVYQYPDAGAKMVAHRG
jgi:hypothetical protein